MTFRRTKFVYTAFRRMTLRRMTLKTTASIMTFSIMSFCYRYIQQNGIQQNITYQNDILQNTIYRNDIQQNHLKQNDPHQDSHSSSVILLKVAAPKNETFVHFFNFSPSLGPLRKRLHLNSGKCTLKKLSIDVSSTLDMPTESQWLLVFWSKTN